MPQASVLEPLNQGRLVAARVEPAYCPSRDIEEQEGEFNQRAPVFNERLGFGLDWEGDRSSAKREFNREGPGSFAHDLKQPLNTRPNQISVRGLTFAIAGNLEEADYAFIQTLLT